MRGARTQAHMRSRCLVFGSFSLEPHRRHFMTAYASIGPRFFKNGVHMNCPGCDSHKVRRSLRRGLVEGVIHRLLLRAPFRCEACGLRFVAFWPGHHFRKRKGHGSIASYLGIRGAMKRKVGRKVAIGAVALLLAALAIWLVMQLSEPSAPSQPQSGP